MENFRGRIVDWEVQDLHGVSRTDQIGDYNRKLLPRRLLYAGNLTLISEISEADTADTVLTHVCVGTATDLTSVVLTCGVLLGLLLLEYHCCFSHSKLPPIILRRERP